MVSKTSKVHLRLLAALALLGSLAACTSFDPRPLDEVVFPERLQTESQEGVTVGAVVLTAEETRQIFDLDLYSRGIQPVWLEITNNDESTVQFLPYSVDDDYFTPLEVSYVHRYRFAKSANEAMDEYIYDLAIDPTIKPGETNTGFVFMHLEPGSNVFNVDVMGVDAQLRHFTFFETRSEFQIDARLSSVEDRSQEASTELGDRAALREMLENLGCCVQRPDGTDTEVPLNVVFVGEWDDLLYALVRAGWDIATEESDTEFFGRPADVVLERSESINESRAYIRLWIAPALLDNKPVWVGQSGRVNKLVAGPQDFVDTTVLSRAMLVEDLMYSQSLAFFGNVRRGDAPSEPRQVDTASVRYFVDGYRTVLGISSDTLSIAEADNLEWERMRWHGSSTRAGADDAMPFLERSQSDKADGVGVTVAVPGPDESKAHFGVDLYRKGIQPVWIEIKNTSDEPVWFLPASVDPEYFTPYDIAAQFGGSAAKKKLDEALLRSSLRFYVAPESRRSGFVFTRVDEGTKPLVVDVFDTDQRVRSFTFFVAVPGLNVDHYNVDFDSLHPEDMLEHHDLASLREALEQLPCCVTNKSGKNTGDPLNLVIIGQPRDLYEAFIRAGWDETETIYAGSLGKTFTSFALGTRYRYSPVSALYMFGRPQDVALQKARDTIHERNHLRLWFTPMRIDGLPVWVGQISRDIGVRLTKKTITTHKIDPDTDEARDYLFQDLWYAQSLAHYGYVSGVGAAAMDAPRGNLTGDPYFTDGLRGVFWISPELMDMEAVQFLQWEVLPEN